MNSHSLTNDLILEILSRLPAKSVARFHCVSKRWASMFVTPYFKDLFLARSSAKPRLLFAVVQDGVWRFFSSPQLEKSSSTLVAAAEFHEARPVICNPITGRYVILPKRYTYRKAYSFFGFDPIDKQYKAVSMIYPSGPGDSKILTFGDGDITWSKIRYPVRHDIFDSEGICINGTSDCANDGHDEISDYVIVCFDVRSEKFTFIDVERFCRLINYKGKLAVIYWEDDVDIHELYYREGIDLDKYVEENLEADAINELRLWILEDVEKQEWSKYAYTWTDDKFFRRLVSIGGVTASGEIVFSMRKYTTKQPFYVFYFNLERNTLQRVEIKGFGEAFKENCRVCTFVNHTEDLRVNDLKQLKSVHPPLVDESDSESD
ncbi:F-box-like domain superfamily [Arabidopsis suecica]|uniref:F-box-like domain superfamily n=1 Tax=Arabidopsis suecica TaxID=45249 RepID=A0A8T2BAY9_ARASU|nr:F-box-like domain superfamily [Arabidopsis suecica]